MTHGTRAALSALLPLLLLLGCGERPSSRGIADQPAIHPHDLRVLYGLGPEVPPGHPLHGRRVVILDARAKEAYDQGHLRTAAHFDRSASFGPLGVGPDGCVVLYAGTDQEAAATAEVLRDRGWQSVFLLEGGLAAAAAVSLPVEATVAPGASTAATAPTPELHGSAVATSNGTHIIIAAEPAGKPALRILATSTLRSVLEGCGCGASGLGIARMATLLRDLRSENVPTLVIDAGELFTGTAELDRRRCLHFLGIMKRLGFQATVAGADAGRFGADFVRNQLVGSPVPLLSANLTIDGARAFAAHRTLEIAGVRIAIVGVTISCTAGSHDMHHGGGPGRKQAGMHLPSADELPGFVIADALGSLTPVLDAARKEADVVVVVGHVPLDLAEALSRLPLPPSLILSANPPPTAPSRVIGGKVKHADGREELLMMHDPRVKRDPTQIFFLGGRPGSSVHWIDLLLDDKKALAEPGYGIALGTLEHTAKDSEVEAFVQSFLDQVRCDPELQKHLPHRLAGFDLESDPENGYVGQEACAKCHEKETEHWKRTPHATAFKTLEKVDRAYYPACLSCHTTGAGHAKGYRPGEPALEKLQNVQCETCHGPGAKHVQEPKKKGLTRRTAGHDLCIRCHDGIEGKSLPDGDLFSLAHRYMSHLDPGVEYFIRRAARGK